MAQQYTSVSNSFLIDGREGGKRVSAHYMLWRREQWGPLIGEVVMVFPGDSLSMGNHSPRSIRKLALTLREKSCLQIFSPN
jgi:hypothetical protein